MYMLPSTNYNAFRTNLKKQRIPVPFFPLFTFQMTPVPFFALSKLKKFVKSLKVVHSESRPRRDHSAINHKTHEFEDDDDDDDDELVGFGDVAEKNLVDRLINDDQKSHRVISLVIEKAVARQLWQGRFIIDSTFGSLLSAVFGSIFPKILNARIC
ncbi:hypothetical protein CsSME_00016491 [Camellia sinensis var. sinensis]